MIDEKLRLYISKKVRGLLSGEHASWQKSTRGYDLEEKRKFRLGDDPRAIDFLSMAKRGGEDPRTSINRIEKGANLIFLIDCSASMRFGTVVEKYQYAIDFVRQISAASLSGGNRLRYLAFSKKIVHDSGLMMSAHAIDEHLAELSQLSAGKDRGVTDFKSALVTLANDNGWSSLRLPSLIFIISDFLFRADFNSELSLVNEHGDVLAFFLRDPAELFLPKPRFGFTRLVDPESNKEFLARNTASPLDIMVPILKKCGVDWLEVNTGLDVGKALENLINLFERKRRE